jgi:hypothetical protein
MVTDGGRQRGIGGKGGAVECRGLAGEIGEHTTGLFNNWLEAGGIPWIHDGIHHGFRAPGGHE